MKQLLSLSLIFSCLAASLLACGDTKEPLVTEKTSDTFAASGDTADTEIPLSSILGFKKEDNGQKTFTIYADSGKSYDFDAEKENGDVVNDAVYAKNTAVEEYLGIDLEFIYRSCDWSYPNEYKTGIANDVLSGDGVIDLVSGITVILMPTVPEGYYMEGANLEVNFENPWWISDMYERFSIHDRLYGFLGDYSLSLYKDLSVIFFNKQIWQTNDMPDLYTLVGNNEWTLDKFIELGTGLGKDINNDGKYEIGTDHFTYVAELVPGGTFQSALECSVVTRGEDGASVYLGLTDRFETAYSKISGLFDHNDVGGAESAANNTIPAAFANSTIAMMSNFLYATERLRDMEDDYGIVPFPKYDASQEKYLSQIGTSTEMLLVPITTHDVSLTSKVMECLGYFMKEYAVPKYYEVALKEKYARDTDMHEMLDLIRDGAIHDFLFVYGTSLERSPFTYFRYNELNQNISSTFEKNEKAFLRSLDKYTKNIAELES